MNAASQALAASNASASTAVSRRRVRLHGLVQGVGFRPFVYRLAHAYGVAGWVRNVGDGVEVEIQGAGPCLDAMVACIEREAPPLARIGSMAIAEIALHPDARDFSIRPSDVASVRTAVVADTAVCEACLDELFDPGNRRHRYAFIGCAQCGPRHTVVERLPYDRAHTSMAAFMSCGACAGEYASAIDRRFHAQSICCADCGPRLALLDRDGEVVVCEDPIAATLARLRSGDIVAIKGQGGFHLCCDARNERSVARLRERKARDEKPFAVMVAGIDAAAEFAFISPQERGLLRAASRPIVLLRKRASCDDELAGIAPGLAWLGMMLPCTSIQHLLFHEAAGRPCGTGWMEAFRGLALVMTSANAGGEPTVSDNDAATERLHGLADAFLVHDCAIVNRCDDSVVRWAADAGPRFLRRARGYAPQAIEIATEGVPVLALGGDLKNTICVAQGSQAFVSEHVGDMETPEARQALADIVRRWLALLDVAPSLIACDLHPDFHSTRLAERIAQARGLPLIRVQHHHAHVAAVLAEHRWTGPVIGIALDGAGFGEDGGIWGGELLRMDAGRIARIGRMLPLRLPGGDRAAREPWRMAAAALHALGRQREMCERFASPAGRAVSQMLKRGLNSPWTSSCGRWFDAAAGLLGVRERNAFEGQAAMLLEGLADRYGPAAPLPGGCAVDECGQLDVRPLLSHIADACDVERAAAVFHATLAAGLAEWARRAAERHHIRAVALSGGCFANCILASAVRRRLAAYDVQVLEPSQVPAGDGGLSLGQAVVARSAYCPQ